MDFPPAVRRTSQVRSDFGNSKKHTSMPSFSRSMSRQRSCFQTSGTKYSNCCMKLLPVSNWQPLRWVIYTQKALPAVPAKSFFAGITQIAACWLKAGRVAIPTTPVNPCPALESTYQRCCRQPAGAWIKSPAIPIRMMCRWARYPAWY